MKSRKILINGLSDNNGGIEAVVLNYCELLNNLNYELHFLCYGETLSQIERIKKWNSKIIRIHSRKQNIFKYRKDIKYVIKKGNYDVVWDNRDSLANLYFLKTSKKYNVSIRILHGHTRANLGGKMKGLLHDFNKKFLIQNYATHMWAVSTESSQYFYPKKVADSVKLIPNCIKFDKFQYSCDKRKLFREEKNISSDAKVIVMVGTLKYPKNQALIIRALEILNNDAEDWILMIAGDGPDLESLVELSKECNVNDKVHFLKMIDNVDELFMAGDVYVMPSFNEGLPVSLLEAQASGLPCVISNQITREAIITEEMNILSPYDEPNKWASMIGKAYGVRKKATFTGNKSRFDLATMGSEFEGNMS